MNGRAPVIVGAAQQTLRPDSAERPGSAIDFMADCVREAVRDTGARALIDQVDALHVVNILSRPTPDPPGELASSLGIRPRLMEYTAIGGNSPQWLVNRVADNLAAGRSRIALLSGCEIMYTAVRSREKMIDPVAAMAALRIDVVGDRRFGSHPVEVDHLADLPVRVYPIIESALRARFGLSLADHRAALGRFAERFSKVAAANPHAWFPVCRTAREAVEISADNRMVSYPYTKYLNAVINVDQAASLIMTTADTAKAAGIPEHRWVYVHGGQDAHDLWFVSQRPHLAESPAIRACVEDALVQAGIGIGDVDLFDLYSCFPCMPRITQEALGILPDDPRPMTLTGGLPYFGGPGSNYSMHAIAEAVARCRADRDVRAVVTANGWYCTKHSVGVYGGRPPCKPWSRMPPERFQTELQLPRALEVDSQPAGSLAVEGYTVWHDRDGQPVIGIVCGKTKAGKRAWAQTRSGDADTLRAMMSDDWVGQTGKITAREGNINRVEF